MYKCMFNIAVLGVCRGDGGSGLVREIPSWEKPTEYRLPFELRGVVSRGSQDCKGAALYTSTTWPWIRSFLNQTIHEFGDPSESWGAARVANTQP